MSETKRLACAYLLRRLFLFSTKKTPVAKRTTRTATTEYSGMTGVGVGLVAGEVVDEEESLGGVAPAGEAVGEPDPGQ